MIYIEEYTYLRTTLVNLLLKSLRAQPTIRSVVHKIWKIMQFHHYKTPEKQKLVFLVHFQLFEVYTYLGKLIVNQVWGVFSQILAQEIGFVHLSAGSPYQS